MDDGATDDGGRGAADGGGAVDLLWIPLGAGAHVVRVSGTVFEAVSAFARRRPRCDLYHSALQISLPEGSYAVEMTPVPDGDGHLRGVVTEGPVGARWAGRWRIFRYEVRRWCGGSIPDAHHAVPGPIRIVDDVERARRVLDVLASVPNPVWGRDELGAGDMWNSNSVISWALAESDVDVGSIRLPAGGRAPGWDAGIAVAGRRPTGTTVVPVRGAEIAGTMEP